MTEREQLERRQKERRTGERRNRPDFICDKCGEELMYFIPEKVEPKDYLWCDGCRQKYVVLQYKDRRNQIARVNNV